MAQINVTQFAKELGLPLELLIEQLQTAGVKKNVSPLYHLLFASEDSKKTRSITQIFDLAPRKQTPALSDGELGQAAIVTG